ncbi:MAG TPA: hypothetical protein VH518_18625 [Tepidisphaeraceae bacterium]|jgi:hypothetical protein
MPETFLILLAGGIMLAAAISDPKQVTLRWLRLAGIIALVMVGLGLFFLMRRSDLQHAIRNDLGFRTGAVAVAILAQLAFVQVAWRRTGRAWALIAFGSSLAVASMMLAGSMPSQIARPLLRVLGCAGVSAMTGLVLMDMLLGHAYLTASQMTMAPFVRLNRAVAITLAIRALLGILVLLLNRPDRMFWNLHAVYLGTRWLVGIIVPGIFIWMAHDCIKRRATQSATGILYVAGVLIFIGEIIGLYLLSQTGLPL